MNPQPQPTWLDNQRNTIKREYSTSDHFYSQFHNLLKDTREAMQEEELTPKEVLEGLFKAVSYLGQSFAAHTRAMNATVEVLCATGRFKNAAVYVPSEWDEPMSDAEMNATVDKILDEYDPLSESEPGQNHNGQN